MENISPKEYSALLHALPSLHLERAKQDAEKSTLRVFMLNNLMAGRPPMLGAPLQPGVTDERTYAGPRRPAPRFNPQALREAERRVVTTALRYGYPTDLALSNPAKFLNYMENIKQGRAPVPPVPTTSNPAAAATAPAAAGRNRARAGGAAGAGAFAASAAAGVSGVRRRRHEMETEEGQANSGGRQPQPDHTDYRRRRVSQLSSDQHKELAWLFGSAEAAVTAKEAALEATLNYGGMSAAMQDLLEDFRARPVG